MEIIKIDTEFITLSQLLKIVGLINTGGQAKYFLLENEVLLNNELESRRGKKLYNKDHIKIGNLEFIISND